MIKHKLGSASFSSVDMTTDTIKQIKDREQDDHKVIPFFIDPIDKYFAPMLPGHLCIIQAQSSNGKSLIMDSWIDFLAKRLINHKDNEIIIKVDLETYIEDHGIIELSRRTKETVANLSAGKVSDWQQLMQAVYDINELGVYRITYGEQQLDNIRDLSMETVLLEIRYLLNEKYGRQLKPACVFVDYLQAIEYGDFSESDRRLKVRKDIYTLRKMGTEFKCPIVVNVQAKQNLTGYEHKDLLIPGLYDGEETSSIAQRCDRMISSTMPKMTHGKGRMLSNIGRFGNVMVTDNLMFIKVNKQRGGLPSGDRWLCEVDYNTNQINVIGQL